MALKQSAQILALLAVQSASGNEAIPITGDFVIPAGLAANDVIEFAALPDGYVPVDVTVAAEDCDSAAGMTLDCGILSGNYGVKDDARTCGNEFFAASTVGQAGGVARATKAAGFMVAPATNTRGIGLKVAALGTPIVGAKIRVIAWVRPAVNGV